MNKGIKVALLGLGGAVALAAAGGASATTTWQAHHPRRAEVNRRLDRQAGRIKDERADGKITAAQARDLHAEDRGIRGQERFDASHDNGHITRSQMAQLNHEENGVSRQIGR